MSNKWKQNVIRFSVRQKFVKFSKIYNTCYYIYIYKSFSTMLDKNLRKNI